MVLPLVPVTPTTGGRRRDARHGGRGERHREARVGDDHLGTATPGTSPLHHCGGGAAGRRLGDEVVTVRAQAGQGAEQGARTRLGGPVDDGGDGTAADQLVEGHAGRDITTGPRRAYGRILMFCRENSAIFSNAGAATSPP